MALIETGNNTPGQQNVDAGSNARVTTPQVNSRYGGESAAPNYVGASRMFVENDSGSLTGTPQLASPFVSFEDNLQVGQMTPLFDYTFNGTAQDTGNWYHAFTTMTMTQGGGYLLHNANNTNTAATGCYLQSKQMFNLTGNAGLKITVILNTTSAFLANEVYNIGLGIPASTTAVPTDGIWIQYTSAGFTGYMVYNNTVTPIGPMPVVSPITMSLSTNVYLGIRIHDRKVGFWYNTVFLGEVVLPAGIPTPFMSDSLPIFTQYYNTGTVIGTSAQIKLATVTVDQLDSVLGKPYSHIQAKKGLSIYQGLQGGTMGATAFWATSANPTAATPVATALTANLPTSLSGGQGIATYWTPGTSDMIMSQAQIPSGTINQTARTLYITGVRISACSLSVIWGAPTSGAQIFMWGIMYGNTTANTSTAESASFVTASVKSPRKVPLTLMSWATGATPIGTPPDRGDILHTFQTPLVVNPGEYLQLICKIVNGSVTPAGALFYVYSFDGYWE